MAAATNTFAISLPGRAVNSVDVTLQSPPVGLTNLVRHTVEPQLALGQSDLLRLITPASVQSILEVEGDIKGELAKMAANWSKVSVVADVLIHGKSIPLTESIKGTMTQDDEGMLLYEVPELEIFARGPDEGAVRREFDTDFEDLVDDIVMVDDSTLSPRAIQLKGRLKALLGWK